MNNAIIKRSYVTEFTLATIAALAQQDKDAVLYVGECRNCHKEFEVRAFTAMRQVMHDKEKTFKPRKRCSECYSRYKAKHLPVPPFNAVLQPEVAAHINIPAPEMVVRRVQVVPQESPVEDKIVRDLQAVIQQAQELIAKSQVAPPVVEEAKVEEKPEAPERNPAGSFFDRTTKKVMYAFKRTKKDGEPARPHKQFLVDRPERAPRLTGVALLKARGKYEGKQVAVVHKPTVSWSDCDESAQPSLGRCVAVSAEGYVIREPGDDFYCACFPHYDIARVEVVADVVAGAKRHQEVEQTAEEVETDRRAAEKAAEMQRKVAEKADVRYTLDEPVQQQVG